MKPQNVMILGGTGFLGYAAARLFADRGARVSACALPGELESLEWVDERIRLELVDLFRADEASLAALFREIDTVVYALGPDDRIVPPAPAYDFFKRHLADDCVRILSAAKSAGVRKCVVLSSYFCYFDRKEKGRLSRVHPYIRARRDQEAAVVALGEAEGFAVSVVEIPYVFGAPVGRKPIWKDALLSHFDGLKRVFFPGGGGTAAVDVSGVAQAVYAAAVNGVHGQCYPVGKENFLFSELIPMMLRYAGDRRGYSSVPAVFCALWTKKIAKKEREAGLENGLYLPKLMTQIQNRKFYIDPAPVQKALGYEALGLDGGRSVEEGVAESMAALNEE